MKDISILFSGGPDSTLAALYALERTDRIHLLTFHHRLMSHYKTTKGPKKHTKVIEELSHRYVKGRILVYEKDIWKLFKSIYFNSFGSTLKQYKSFLIPWLCGACKLAMHISTIRYNEKYGIETTYDGCNKESGDVFPAQSIEYISLMKNFYKSYKMTYDTPIYNIAKTDKETEKFGMKSCRGTKDEHIFFSTQHSCFTGLLLHAHSRLYYRPIRKQNIGKISGVFLDEKLNAISCILP